MARGWALAFALLGLLAAAPRATSHPAELAPENYTRFLGDCSDDWGGHQGARDGHDHIALDVAERWMHEHSEPGLFILLTMGAGFAEFGSQGGPLVDEVKMGLADGTRTTRLRTMNNQDFTADAGPGLTAPDLIFPPRASLLRNGTQDEGRFLVEYAFRFSTLGLSVGEKVLTFTTQAYAREDRGDYMPGGYYLLGVQDPECPASGSHGGTYSGVYVRKDYTLEGPEAAYFSIRLGTDRLVAVGNQTVTLPLTITSAFSKQSQELIVVAEPPPGWSATTNPTDGTTSLGPHASKQWDVRLAAQETATNGTLAVWIDSDVGGHAERTASVAWSELAAPATSTPPPGGSPGPGAMAVVLGAALGLAVRRRRPREPTNLFTDPPG